MLRESPVQLGLASFVVGTLAILYLVLLRAYVTSIHYRLRRMVPTDCALRRCLSTYRKQSGKAAARLLNCSSYGQAGVGSSPAGATTMPEHPDYPHNF